MVRKISLYIRMLVSGSLLFLFYALGVLVLMQFFNVGYLPITLLTVLFIIFQYIVSQKMILRSVNSKELPNSLNWIDHFAQDYSREKGMNKPDIYLASMGTPNAFAFGRRNNGTIVVSEELIDRLEREEIKGVIAHELAHIENRDSIIMLLGQSISTVVGFATILIFRRQGSGFIASYLAGQLAQVVVSIVLMAISRYREYLADETAAKYMGTGKPLSMALKKIQSSQESKRMKKELDSEVGALCIINANEILSTHPPIEKRVERLEKKY